MLFIQWQMENELVITNLPPSIDFMVTLHKKILIKSVTQVRSKLFNFRLKSQLEVALHQHKVLEGELERSKAEVEEQVDTFSIKTMIDYKVLYV